MDNIDIDNFYQLIRSQDERNAMIAWTLARAMKEAGDSYFADFVKAVYGWAFSDLPPKKPADFLNTLYDLTLHCKVLRKEQIPPISFALAPLVEHIEIEDIQTVSCPRGFEVFSTTKSMFLRSQKVSSLGDELAQMPSLERLHFATLKDLEILPEFAAFMTSLKHLELQASMHAKIELPENMQELNALKSLAWLNQNTLPKQISNCIQLQELTLEPNYLVDWKKFNYSCAKLAALPNLKSLNIMEADSSNHPTFPSFVCLLPQLECLRLSMSSLNFEYPKQFLALQNLKELHLREIRIRDLILLAKMPALKKLVFAKSFEFKELQNYFYRLRPDVKVEMAFDQPSWFWWTYE